MLDDVFEAAEADAHIASHEDKHSRTSLEAKGLKGGAGSAILGVPQGEEPFRNRAFRAGSDLPPQERAAGHWRPFPFLPPSSGAPVRSALGAGFRAGASTCLLHTFSIEALSIAPLRLHATRRERRQVRNPLL